MHESFRSLRPVWILIAWVLAVAVASFVLIAAAALGAVSVGAPREHLWVLLSVIIGFLVGGFIVGNRANAAPLLHAVAMLVFSIVVVLVVNLLGAPSGVADWYAVVAGSTLLLLLAQLAASIVGARAGVRWARRNGAA